MSSHHIVRDQQEPALILYRSDHFPLPVLESLLAWSPTVMCCEAAIQRYSKLGYKLDVAVVSLGNLDIWKENLNAQQPIAFVAAYRHFLLDAFEWLRKQGHKTVNIVADENSFDDVVNILLNWLAVFEIVLFTEKRRTVFFNGPVYKKWLPAHAVIHILPVSKASYISTSGFSKNLQNECLQQETKVKMKKEGLMEIASSEPPFLISEAL